MNRSQYSAAPYFIWQKMRAEPVYHHAVMRDYYRGEAREFQRNLTLPGYLQRGTQKFLEWWKFYLGPLLTVPLLTLPWIIRQRKMRLPLAICAAMIAAFAVQIWTLPHYFSPAAGALYILLTQGLRHMYARRGIARDAALAIPILALRHYRHSGNGGGHAHPDRASPGRAEIWNAQQSLASYARCRVNNW